jgi:hypothetical protein
MGAVIKSLPGNSPKRFRMHGQVRHLTSAPYKNTQISQNMETFIFPILLKQEQNDFKTSQIGGAPPKRGGS